MGWGPAVPLPTRRRRWWPVAVVLAVLVLSLGFVVHVNYDAVAPGSAGAVNGRVAIRGGASSRPAGKILFVTVSLRQHLVLYDWLWSSLDDNIDIVKEKLITGNLTPQQFNQQSIDDMALSKRLATLVALSHLPTVKPEGAEISRVDSGFPASSQLRANDIIVGIDTKPVSVVECAIQDIRAHHPGDTVRLHLLRNNKPIEVDAVLGTDQGRAVLGVLLEPKLNSPFQVNIDSGNVGGPSAGVAFALEVLDQLTQGKLTGGATVAATGELADASGDVFPIGGVAQKVVAVERAGAKLFLVPRDNLDEARHKAGRRLRVEPITTVDDALRAMAKLPGSNAGQYVRSGPIC